MHNSNYSKIENNLAKLPEEIREFNNLLLSTNWENVDFNVLEGNYNSSLSSQIFTNAHRELIHKLVKLVPEWKRVIGCKQHITHSFCLDIHILLVVKKIMEQEQFKKLNNYYKLITLWSALLHDIKKNENMVDPDHPLKGAAIADIVLNRLGFDNYFIKSVYKLVRYHPLIGFIAIEKLKLDIPDIIKKIDDEKIVDLFIIFSIADIKAVKSKDAFFNSTIDTSIKRIHAEIFNHYKI